MAITGGFAILLALLPGCVSTSISESEDSVDITAGPEDFIIKGGAQASTRQFRVLFWGFGEDNSFLRAETKAYGEMKADALLNRTRLKSYEGLMIPSLWLSWLGVDDASDFPIVGWEIYTVAGTGVIIPAWHDASH